MALKAAVIGCGRIGAAPSSRVELITPSGWFPISHIESFQSASNIDLVALAEKDTKKLETAGERYNITKLYKDFKELIKIEKPDIVSIATRTAAKSDIILESCNGGVRGLYVEKPFANNLKECLKLFQTIKENNCFISYGVIRRFHSIYRQAKAIIADGKLGKLIEIAVEYGNAPLLWSHPHSMDLLIYFGGVPKTIKSILDNDTVKQKGDKFIDSDPLIVRTEVVFETGVRGTISVSPGRNLRIMGEKGNLIIYADGTCIQFTDSLKNNTININQHFIYPNSSKSPSVIALEELAMAIDSEISKPDYNEIISLRDIELGMRLLIGAVWSHIQDGIDVCIKDIPEDLIVTGRIEDLYP